MLSVRGLSDDNAILCKSIGVVQDWEEEEGRVEFTLSFGANPTYEKWPLDPGDTEDVEVPYFFIDVVYAAPSVELAKQRLKEDLQGIISEMEL